MKIVEVLEILQADGWRLVRQKGSHRQLQHPNKPGTVTVAGKPSVDIPAGTLNSMLKQAGLNPMQYMVVVEQGPTSFGAYVPDLPGCVAAGESRDEVVTLIREAIEMHLEALQEQGQSPPAPRSTVELVDVAA